MKLFLLPFCVLQTLYAGVTAEPRLHYATYIDTPSAATRIAVDAAGNAFVIGAAHCAITKINPSGTSSNCLTLPVAGFLSGIAIDAAGAIYTVVSELNTDASATLFKLSPDGRVIYAVTVPGASPICLDVDRLGRFYLTGIAGSRFPTTPGAYQRQLRSGAANQPFALRLNSAGVMDYATFLDPLQSVNAIAADSKGQAWLAGSVTGQFGGQLIITYSKGWILKLNSTATQADVVGSFATPPVPSSGMNSDVLALAIDSSDSVYAAGYGFVANGRKSILAKYSASGDLVYSITPTAPGGFIWSLAVDGANNPYFFATNVSPPLNSQATVCGRTLQSQLTVLSADGSQVLASVYFSGEPRHIVLDQRGDIYVTGVTAPMPFLATPGAYQPIYPGSSSVFAAKFDASVPQSGPSLTCAVNAASLSPGIVGLPTFSVAPGEILSLGGRGLAEPIRIRFDNYSAPILYADANQINAVVPFEVSGVSSNLWIETAHDVIGPIVLPVIPAVPGIFSNAIVNEDGGVNSEAHPAKRGSTITAYMTGAGLMSPSMATGATGPVSPPYPYPVLGVSATFAGKSYSGLVAAPVVFAGQAPGLIAGAVQVNIQVPDTLSPGVALLNIHIGNFASATLGSGEGVFVE